MPPDYYPTSAEIADNGDRFHEDPPVPRRVAEFKDRVGHRVVVNLAKWSHVVDIGEVPKGDRFGFVGERVVEIGLGDVRPIRVIAPTFGAVIAALTGGAP